MTKKIEGLSLFLAWSPFWRAAPMPLDRAGAWTEDMADAFEGEDGPARAGLWVWEGRCEVDEGEDGVEHTFTGTWRTAAGREWERLIFGCCPLSGRPFPETSDLEPFEQGT